MHLLLMVSFGCSSHSVRVVMREEFVAKFGDRSISFRDSVETPRMARLALVVYGGLVLLRSPFAGEDPAYAGLAGPGRSGPVLLVLLVCSSPQMGRVNAMPHMASVVYLIFCRQRPDERLVCEPVNADADLLVTVGVADDAVSLAV
jgi:hypothetical protein